MEQLPERVDATRARTSDLTAKVSGEFLNGHAKHGAAAVFGADLVQQLDQYSLEQIVEHKISRFFDQLGSFYPDDVHDLIIQKVEKPLIGQVLKRVGGNQVHAARILGINRNTLRKKMKIYGFA